MKRLPAVFVALLVATCVVACASGPVRRVSEPAAGTLRGNAGITIGPESADVATLPFAPSADARLRIADALAARRSIAYTLAGRVDATPEDGGTRSFEVDRDSALTPVPGLPGVQWVGAGELLDLFAAHETVEVHGAEVRLGEATRARLLGAAGAAAQPAGDRRSQS